MEHRAGCDRIDGASSRHGFPPSLAFSHIDTDVFSRSNSQRFTMSQLSDMHGNADISLNTMPWSRGGERPEILAGAAETGDHNVVAR
jgi:hypothetical protein